MRFMALAVVMLMVSACGSTVQNVAIGEEHPDVTGQAAPSEEGYRSPLELQPDGGEHQEADVDSVPLPDTATSSAPPVGPPLASGAPVGAVPAAQEPSTPRGAGQVRAGEQSGGQTRAQQPSSHGTQDRTAQSQPAAPAVRGVTASELRIGISFIGDRDAANRAAAGAVPGTGDPRAQHDAMVAWVNKNGGIAGRKVVPFYRPYNSADDPATIAQSICAHHADDNQVYAAFPEYASPQLVSCLANRGVITIGSDVVPDFDDAAFTRYDSHLFFANTFSLSRIFRLTASGLAKEGFYDRKGAIGVVTVDQPEFRRAYEQDFVPELARAGFNVKEVLFVSGNEHRSVGSIAAQIGNAIVRFHSSGVTHVVFLESAGWYFVAWTQAAEQQQYRPRYGVNSGSFVGGLRDLYPTEQLRGLQGIGWVPMYDANEPGDPGPTPRAKECIAIMNANGAPPKTRVEMGRSAVVCDYYFFLKDALHGASDLSAPAVRARVEALTTAFRPALTFTAKHGRGRHDGAGAYGTTRYDARCNCIVFYGERHRVD